MSGDDRYIRNAIRCHACGGFAVSEHVHDFKRCPCGRVAADGGPEYLRRSYRHGARWTEDSVERMADGSTMAVTSEGPARRPVLASDSGVDLDTADEGLTDDDWREIASVGYTLAEVREMWGDPPARWIGRFGLG